MTSKKINYDDNLWFEHKGCEGKHYLIGNPHTFTGRMWAYCPKKNKTFFVSKSDIGDKSIETDYWIKGFLTGNQPAPPKDKNDDVDFESQAYKDWIKKVDKFEKTGLWE